MSNNTNLVAIPPFTPRVDVERCVVTLYSGSLDSDPPNVALTHGSSIPVPEGMGFLLIRAFGEGSEGVLGGLKVWGLNRDLSDPVQWQPHFIVDARPRLGALAGVEDRVPSDSHRWVDEWSIFVGDGRVRLSPDGGAATLIVPTDGAERVLLLPALGEMTEIGLIHQFASGPHNV